MSSTTTRKVPKTSGPRQSRRTSASRPSGSLPKAPAAALRAVTFHISGIGALCPYCMVVWAVVIPLFWYVTARNVAAGALGSDPDGRLADVLRDWRGPLVFGTFLVVVLLVLERFWSYWSSLP